MIVDTGWHEWHAAREAAVAEPYGPAALESTNWLTHSPTTIDGVPGLWSAADGVVLGTGLSRAELQGVAIDTEGAVTLTPGAEARWGELLLRVFQRGDSLAVRIFDPQRATLTRLRGIDVFAPSEEWRIPGVFEPGVGETVTITAVDGEEHESEVAGRIRFPLGDDEARLTVTRGRGGLSAVFADATNGLETYRFRFLAVDEPDANGAVVLAFTRAYLPPCAFSDQFVCPLPLAGNRYATPIRAGEKGIVLA